MTKNGTQTTTNHRIPAARLEIESVSKALGGETVLHDVSLRVEPGTCLALLGPSGSGKSTLLNCIAGFETPDQGDIRITDQSIVALPTHRRSIGMVFQQYALFPHLSVARNIAYPLVRQGIAAAERDRRVARLLETVQLSPYAHHAATALSGGQQQRVAIARALAAQPGVLLMDEPMGALDRALREQLQIDLKRLLQKFGATVVYVTHDQREALALADTLAILRDGRIEQAGPTEQVYAAPATAFAARFLWSGANGLAARVGSVSDGVVEGITLDRAIRGRWHATSSSPAPGSTVELVVRPEDVLLSDPASAPADALPATVTTTLFAGDHRAIQLRLADGTMVNATQRLDQPAARPGEALALSWRAETGLVFPTEAVA